VTPRLGNYVTPRLGNYVTVDILSAYSYDLRHLFDFLVELDGRSWRVSSGRSQAATRLKATKT